MADSKMNFEEWCNEFVRIVQERAPGIHAVTAKDIAEALIDLYNANETPEEAVEGELECWTDDYSGEV